MSSLLQDIITTDSLDWRFAGFAWENTPIFKLSPAKIEQQANWRLCRLEIIDYLGQFVIRELVAERLDFHY